MYFCNGFQQRRGGAVAGERGCGEATEREGRREERRRREKRKQV